MWQWWFDYHGPSSPNVNTANTSTTWTYTQPGTYTVAVLYTDDDCQQGDTFKFPITIIQLKRFYYLKDHLGNIRVTVDAGGSVQSYDDYYPFGMSMEGRSANLGQGDMRYKFTSKERDIETGYDYFGARYYDARIGRFLTLDPLAGNLGMSSLSPYHYSYNNPLRFIDPKGLSGYDPGEGEDPPGGTLENAWNGVKMMFSGCESKQTPPRELNSPLSSDGQAAAVGINATLEEVKQNTHGALNGVADFSENFATGTQVAGVGVGVLAVGAAFVAPPAAPVLGSIAGGLLTASSGSDGLALLARGVDAAQFGGSMDAFTAQGFQVGADLLSQGLSEGAVGLVIRETQAVPTFRSVSTGRYLKNSFGYAARAVADMTAIGTASVTTRMLLNETK
jgi:RHS repeat-associated protein